MTPLSTVRVATIKNCHGANKCKLFRLCHCRLQRKHTSALGLILKMTLLWTLMIIGRMSAAEEMWINGCRNTLPNSTWPETLPDGRCNYVDWNLRFLSIMKNLYYFKIWEFKILGHWSWKLSVFILSSTSLLLYEHQKYSKTLWSSTILKWNVTRKKERAFQQKSKTKYCVN